MPAAGNDVFRLRAEIGMVFQSFNLFAHKSVVDNITLGPIKVKGMSQQDATGLARGLLERVADTDVLGDRDGAVHVDRGAVARGDQSRRVEDVVNSWRSSARSIASGLVPRMR